MKKVKWSLVIILTIVFRSNLYSYNYYGFSFGTVQSMNKLQNTFSLGLSLYMQTAEFDRYVDTNNRTITDVETKWHSFRIESALFSYDWILKDDYNNYKYNHSFFSNLNLPSFYLLAFVEGVLINGNKSHYVPSWWVFLPFMITNNQMEFGFLNLGSYHPLQFDSYLYFRNKIDYFAKNDNDFWRFKIGMGISLELRQMISRRLSDHNYYSLKFDFGYDKIFDYALDKWYTKKLIPSFKLSFSFAAFGEINSLH